jgi:hypothetical protein
MVRSTRGLVASLAKAAPGGDLTFRKTLSPANRRAVLMAPGAKNALDKVSTKIRCQRGLDEEHTCLAAQLFVQTAREIARWLRKVIHSQALTNGNVGRPISTSTRRAGR